MAATWTRGKKVPGVVVKEFTIALSLAPYVFERLLKRRPAVLSLDSELLTSRRAPRAPGQDIRIPDLQGALRWALSKGPDAMTSLCRRLTFFTFAAAMLLPGQRSQTKSSSMI